MCIVILVLLDYKGSFLPLHFLSVLYFYELILKPNAILNVPIDSSNVSVDFLKTTLSANNDNFASLFHLSLIYSTNN